MKKRYNPERNDETSLFSRKDRDCDSRRYSITSVVLGRVYNFSIRYLATGGSRRSGWSWWSNAAGASSRSMRSWQSTNSCESWRSRDELWCWGWVWGRRCRGRWVWAEWTGCTTRKYTVSSANVCATLFTTGPRTRQWITS